MCRKASSDAVAAIGLRQPHYREVSKRRLRLGLVEAHGENFFLAASLAPMTERVGHVQETPRRQILVENVTASVRFRDGTMFETAFPIELARRSGCGVLPGGAVSTSLVTHIALDSEV